MTEKNYFVAHIYNGSNNWVTKGPDGRFCSTDGLQCARRFSREEAEAYVEEHYAPHDWIKWAIFKIDLVASYKDSPLQKLARAAEE